jgi:hypothetical protein
MCSFFVTRKSKTELGDKKGPIVYTRHIDPLRDAAFYHGLMWIVRFLIKGELGGSFPNFHLYHMLCEMGVYHYVKSNVKIGATMMAKIWCKVLRSVSSIDIGKLTHQWKGQGCREMKESGIATNDISWMVGQKAQSTVDTDALNQSYLTEPPSSCIVQRAGGDPQNP